MSDRIVHFVTEALRAEMLRFAINMRSHYRSLMLMRATAHAPSSVDRLLHRLALKGDLIYGSFARGSSFITSEGDA